jgi:hypothetical protein
VRKGTQRGGGLHLGDSETRCGGRRKYAKAHGGTISRAGVDGGAKSQCNGAKEQCDPDLHTTRHGEGEG